jgi:hypothetical protein
MRCHITINYEIRIYTDDSRPLALQIPLIQERRVVKEASLALILGDTEAQTVERGPAQFLEQALYGSVLSDALSSAMRDHARTGQPPTPDRYRTREIIVPPEAKTTIS